MSMITLLATNIFPLTYTISFGKIREKEALQTNSINDRVSEVIRDSKITKTAFASKINISQPTVSLICSGQCGVSDRVISDICRVFRVNETWLRTGAGEKYRKKARAEELAEIFADLEVDDTVKARCIRTLAELPEEYFIQAMELGKKFLEQWEKENTG